MLVKHFKQIGELWQLNADIRGMVQHRQLNLLKDFSHLGTFDLIFCRNVMIYFDRPTQAKLVSKFHHYLKPGGYLFIGHSESLQRLDQPFKSVAPTIYQKET
jgi:chemotaxis protein methyltransferase CheR